MVDRARHLLGAQEAVLIIDATWLPKSGNKSVATVKTQRVFPANVHLLPLPKPFEDRLQNRPATSADAEALEVVWWR